MDARFHDRRLASDGDHQIPAFEDLCITYHA